MTHVGEEKTFRAVRGGELGGPLGHERFEAETFAFRTADPPTHQSEHGTARGDGVERQRAAGERPGRGHGKRERIGRSGVAIRVPGANFKGERPAEKISVGDLRARAPLGPRVGKAHQPGLIVEWRARGEVEKLN